MAGGGEERSGEVVGAERRAGPPSGGPGPSGAFFVVLSGGHLLPQAVRRRASPAGCEGDNSPSQRSFGDVPVGVSDEAAPKRRLS